MPAQTDTAHRKQYTTISWRDTASPPYCSGWHKSNSGSPTHSTTLGETGMNHAAYTHNDRQELLVSLLKHTLQCATAEKHHCR